MPHATPELRKAYEKERYQRRKEAQKEKLKKWRSENSDRVKETQKQNFKRWYERNKSHHSFNVRKRKQSISSKNELEPGQWEEMVRQCDNTCVFPGCTTSPVTMDHVIPLSKGGRHHISNLQPLCQHHNDKKATKDTDYRGSI